MVKFCVYVKLDGGCPAISFDPAACGRRRRAAMFLSSAMWQRASPSSVNIMQCTWPEATVRMVSLQVLGL